MTPAPAFPATLPLARYRFTARVQQPLALPDYAGSLLRGQFGAALRFVACMTRQPTCHGCPLLQTCPYTRIFEAPPPARGEHTLQDFSQIPNPYVMEPPTPGAGLLAAGDEFQFHLVLVGHAVDQLALVVFALQRALSAGLTRARVPANLIQVDWIHAQGAAQPVWTHAQATLAAHPATLQIPDAPSGMDAITLHIHTPLRLQHQGHPLRPDKLGPRALVAAVARRVALVMEFHAGQTEWGGQVPALVQMAETLHDQRDLHWHDWTRYSSRQQQEMTLGGVLGTWTLRGSPEVLSALWPWLWLGQWLHAGKNATMGMGGYTLESAP